ncbi:hypothetical protein L7F22_063095 [Adiantum nelumboides]|nr:hypothetical protein [Adiantum nelumboides]
MIKINKLLKKELKDKAWNLFLKFKDVFAWEQSDLKGVDPEVCQHTIPLKPDARPVRLQRYRMNPNYAKKVKEEIDNLLKAGFITKVASSDWIFPIVVVPKKNGKLRVCVDYRKLNAQTVKDSFPLPFTDMMLDDIAGHEMYSFMDGYSGYNQLKIAPKDRSKTTFIAKWGAFMFLVMPFGLCNAAPRFQRMPRQKTARQWDKSPYEVDELSTNEKSHIPDEVLAQIPAHIFIAKFKDDEGDNIKTTIMPREIWTLHRRPEVASVVRAVHLEQFFRLPPWGSDYMRAHELMSSIQYDGKAMLTNSDGSRWRC